MDKCWDEVLDTIPETLAVRREAFRQLLSGRAVTVGEVAAATGLSPAIAREAIDLVVSVGMAETDGEAILGIDGITTRPTQHLLRLDGVRLWTWCAYDIVGIAAALGADAVGDTRCGLCGRRLEVIIQRGEPEPSTVMGWLPDESCSNVMAEFCPSALLFCSGAHLDEWRTREARGSGVSLDIASLADRGRSFWNQLVL